MRRALPLLVLALLGAAPAAHAARRAPCTESGGRPLCEFREVKVVFIADGDTIRVREGGRIRTIRFTGLNAMELTRYSKYPSRRRGACHGLEATSVVERAVRRSHWRVRLSAQLQSSHSRHRERRSVWVKSGGRWHDLARMVLERGLALWLPNGIETAHNREYLALAERAAAAGRGLYDPAACGAGPDQDIPITVTVNWDADGNDAGNLDGEWAEVHNGGSRTLDLSDWWLRDSWLRPGRAHAPGYRFARGTALPPGGTLRLHAGCGSDSARDLHWCQQDAVFENVVGSMGDGGYLFDPGGDLRAWSIYPCVVACRDPLAGRVSVTAHPSKPESIAIENTSGDPVDLGGHVVKLHLHGEPDAFVFGYPFEAGTVLQPGQAMRVLPGGSPGDDGALVRHLGRGEFVMPDGRGAVSLRTTTDLLTGCDAWGGGRCR
jgi:micrococcal nuclease